MQMAQRKPHYDVNKSQNIIINLQPVDHLMDKKIFYKSHDPSETLKNCVIKLNIFYPLTIVK